MSSNYNENVAGIVAKSLQTVGLDGVINMTESPVGFTRFALVNGLVIERGFVSPLFAETILGDEADEADDGEEDFSMPMQSNPGVVCELEHPLVLVIADKINKIAQIVPILEMVKKKGAGRPLLLVCEDLQEEPMSTMLYNNKKGIVQCCAVNMPWMAGIEKENLKDIAAMTGATIIDNEHKIKLDEIEMTHFGTAKTINVDEYFTHIVSGGFKQEDLDKRIEEIKITIE